ncbi:MAG TPA: hypothetical protein VFQ53_35555 [Kofleriaceae bacterium]|nr:hypothetical protein [Kofleriaceae bacterium]
MKTFVIVALIACAWPAAAAAHKPKRSTPCFPERTSLSASAMFKTLEKFAWSLYDTGDAPPPKGSYGTCTVEKNVVRDASGKTVAELGCGVRIVVPGIHNDLGIEVGARGRDVLASPKRPKTPLVCRGNGEGQTWCRFDRLPDTDTDLDGYVLAGELGEEVLTGKRALAWFRDHRIVEIHTSVWCH